jgi:hypothetical protein
LTCFAGDEPENDLKVSVSGLRVVAPQADEAMHAFNWRPGTTVALLIKSAAGGLIQFDQKNSAIARFTDDKGNDLLAKPIQPRAAAELAGFGQYGRISKDGKTCAIEVTAPNPPAKGSTALKLQGIVAVLAATEKKEFIQKDVPIQDGSKVTAGTLELKLDKVGKTDRPEEPLALAFRASREVDELAEIRFFKADGTEIKARKVGDSLMALMGSTVVEWYYNLSERVDVATIKVFLWTDLQKKKVMFSLDVDVGL